jgi:hypothetical protein
MKQIVILSFSILCCFLSGQKLEIGKEKIKLPFDGSSELAYDVELVKNAAYLFTAYQSNIDVEIILRDTDGKQVMRTDVADGRNGYDRIDFTANKDGIYHLIIRSVEKEKKPAGTVEISVKKFSTKEMKSRKKISEELKEENSKDVLTLDITHFWEAYDQLPLAKTTQDSINIIQKMYLNRATEGLKEFQKVRYFEAESFVERIRKYPKFYNSVRNNTMIPLQEGNFSSVTDGLKKIYPNAQPAKICFTVGPMSTGGTVSNGYLLIGIEMISGSSDCDVSEITNENLKGEIMSRTGRSDVIAFIKEMVTHEYIHTQQKKIDKNACSCWLLENIIKEGVASFVSEKLILNTKENNSKAFKYVQENEKKLWEELKGQLCSKDVSRWLYNAASSKDRPGDLGYRMGYNMAEAYYNNTADKKEAVKEMIEMDNPLLFLDKSRYDLKLR